MAVTVAQMVNAGLSGLSADRDRLDTVDNYLKGNHEPPYMPTSATAEYKLLATRCVSNWMPLIVKTPAQALAVSGYRKGDEDSSPEWNAWQANRMDSRQNAVHFAALSYGQSFVAVTKDPISGDVKMKGISPRKGYASYTDPASDDLPLWFLQLDNLPDPSTPDTVTTGVLYDTVWVTPVTIAGGYSPDGLYNPKVAIGTRYRHGMTLNGKPVCPVVRFAPDIDLEGRVTGLVEPLIPHQDRANQTTFDRLVAQTFGSFKVRTISGMAPEFERDADGAIVYDETTGKPKPIPVRADASRFMMAPDKDTKFQTLDETPLDGFLAAYESDVKTIAAVSQTPPHYLLGSVVNLSAEALAAAEAALMRFVADCQFSFGESWELVLFLTAEALGSQPDSQAQVSWADFQSRSLSQTMDAWGKGVQMLGIPPRAVWGLLPGVSNQDVEKWAAMQDAGDPAARLADSINQALSPAPPAENAVTDNGA